MSTTVSWRFLLAVILVGCVTLTGSASAAGGGPEGGDVGAHIYSSTPLTPNHSFTLKIQIATMPMKVLHGDMMHKVTPMSHPRKIPCLMSPDKAHPDKITLTCMPAPRFLHHYHAT